VTHFLFTVLFLARVRSAHVPQRILWIGAHPDDESLVAPLLGHSCVEAGDVCSMLVMTRGEAGGDPTVRSDEMQRAADLFRAHLTLWDFADVMADVDATWSAQAGGHGALVDRLLASIIEENPNVVYTFDPNHGSSCHPAHRETGALVIEAVARLGSAAPRLIFVETTITYLADGFAFGSAASDAIAIDARPTWHFMVDDIAIHASQFTGTQLEELRDIADSERVVFLATVPAQKYSCGR
jgi:LmbE family N-acetylglucosaminyl deacetylase